MRADTANRTGWLLMAPAMVVLLIMTIAPSLYLFGASLFRFNLTQAELAQFVGLGNYLAIVQNADFWQSIIRTVAFVAMAVACELVFGLLLALALARQSLTNNLASALFILPMAITPVVSALLWRELLNPNYGWIDYYLQTWGIIRAPIAWLSDPTTAWISVIAMDVWQWTPFVALILMAGLQGLPQEPKEAAAVDGATGWQLFTAITLPMLRPFIAIAVLLRTLDAFKTFGTIKVLTGGGPGTSTEIVNLTIYRVALQDFSVGAAAALGITFLILLSIIVPQLLNVMARNTDLVEAS